MPIQIIKKIASSMSSSPEWWRLISTRISLYVLAISFIIAVCAYYDFKNAVILLSIISFIIAAVSIIIRIFIHKKSMPRSITAENANIITNQLRKKTNSIQIVRAGSLDEIQAFSNEIADIFKEAGWSITMGDGPEHLEGPRLSRDKRIQERRVRDLATGNDLRFLKYALSWVSYSVTAIPHQTLIEDQPSWPR
jgi:membrane protein YdbS with pleckstrin-like domain